MEIKNINLKLSQNKTVFKSLFQDITEEQIQWKPSEEKWSLLQVACHLLDEEREDFRQRLDYTLHKQGETWPPIDPQGWVISRAYHEKNFAVIVEEFLKERSQSIIWLSQLQNPNWDNFYTHPQAGVLTAKQILTNWLAHDYLHIRQITRLNYQYLEKISAPLKLHYAGNW
jgi:hypothetical protein